MKKAEAGGHDEKKGGHEKPVDVYILSRRFGYQPEVLRLERGVSYKFRIMPMDADHGASISFGNGSRIIRCRAGVLTEIELRFEKKGEFFMYCTVYCGDGHDVMRSKIIVA
jgi:heme/copper-type cytochrome/quinol oxidase subunit 2